MVIPSGGSGTYTFHLWTGDLTNPDPTTLSATNIVNPVFQTSTPGTYKFDYTVIDNATCSDTYNDYTIVVKALPDLNNGLGTTICSGDNPHLELSITSGLPSPTYSWGAPAYSDGSITGGNAGANDSITDILVNKFTSSNHTANYSVTPRADGCDGATENVIITIKPEPVVANQTATYCSDKTMDHQILLDNFAPGAGVEFTWPDPDHVDMAGGSARGVAGDANIQDSYTNLTNSNKTATYQITPVINSCSGDPKNISFTIRPEPIVNSGLNKTVCSDESTGLNLSVAAGSVAAASYNVNTITVPAGLTPSGGNALAGNAKTANAYASDKYTNITASPINVTYRVVPVSAANCVGDTVDVVITINPEPVLDPNLNNTVCSDLASGITLGIDALNAGVAAASYNIITINKAAGLIAKAGNAVVANTRPANAIAGDVFTNTTGGNLTVQYSIAPVSGSNCIGDTVVVTLTVKPEPVMNAGLNGSTCSDSNTGLSLSVAAGSVAAANYNVTDISWDTDLSPNGGNVGTANGVAANYLSALKYNNVTNAPQNITMDVAPFGTNGCLGDTLTITYAINPEPIVNSGLNKTVCSDESTGLNLSVAAGSVAAASYNVNTITVPAGLTPSGGNALAGNAKTANAYASDKYTNITASPINVTYRVVPVSAANCVGDTVDVVITINPEPVLDPNLNNTVCSDLASGITLGIDALNAGVAAASYNIITINKAAGLIAKAGNAVVANTRPANAIAGDVFTNTTGGNLTVQYSIAPVSGSNCIGDTVVVTLTVKPEPVMNAGLNGSTCSDSNTGLSLSVAAGSVAAANYNVTDISWDTDLSPNGGNVGTANGVAANYLSALKYNNVTNAPQNITMDVAPFGTNGCLGDTLTITYAINPEPIVNSGLNKTVCSDESTGLNLSVAAGSVAAASYNVNTITVPAGLTPSGGNALAGNAKTANAYASDKYTNITASPINVTYRVVPVSAANCVGDTVDVVITINPEPVLDPNLNNTVCSDLASGITLGIDALNAGVAAASYNIITINKAAGLIAKAGNAVVANTRPANAIAGDVFTNTTGGNLTVQYSIAPVSGSNCIGDTVVVTLTVKPEPVMNAGLNGSTCSDSNTGLSLSVAAGSVAAANYNVTDISWDTDLSPNGGNVGTANGVAANYLSALKYNNVTNAPQNITMDVAPFGTNGCLGDTLTITYAINPEPIVNSGLNKTVCSDESTGLNLSVAAGSVAAASYNVNTITVPAGLTPSGGNALAGNAKTANAYASDKYTNITASPINVTYRVVPVSAANCVGDTVDVVITINPEPVLDPNLNNTVCSDLASGITLGIDALNAGVAAASYNIITINKAAGLIAKAGNAVVANTRPANAIAGDVFTNTTGGNLTVQYSIAPVSGSNCIGDTVVVTLTVKPEPVMNAGLNGSTCSDSNTGLSLSVAAGSVAAANYNVTDISWDTDLSPNGGNVGTANGVAANYLSALKYNNVTNAPQNITMDVAPFGTNGCLGDTLTITYAINPEPIVNSGLNKTVCSDESTGLNLSVAAGSVAAASYNVNTITVPAGLTPSGGNALAGNAKTANAYASDKYTNITASPINVTYRVVPVSAANCVGDTVDVVITINPEPVLDPNLNNTVCSDLASGITLGIDALNAGVAAASYNIITINKAAGLIAKAGNAVVANTRPANAIAGDVFTNTTGGNLTVQYSIAPVSGSNCIGDTVVVTLTVKPEPVMNAGLNGSTCSDSNTGLSLSVAAGSVAAANYNVTDISWDTDLSPNGGNVGTANGVAANYLSALKYNNVTNAPQNITMDVAPFGTNGCLGDTLTITYAINPEPIVNSGLNKTVCSDESTGLNLSVAAGSVAAASYNVNTITVPAGLTPSGGNALAGNAKTANAYASDKYTNITASPINVTYRVVPVSAANCVGDTVDVVITINPEPVLDPNLNNTVCSDLASGITLGIDALNAGVAAASYNIITINKAAGLIAKAGNAVVANTRPANAIAGDVFTNTTGGNLTVQYSIAPVSGSNCIGDTVVVTLTVKPEPVMNAGLNGSTCSDSNTGLSLSVAAGSVAAANYNVTDISWDTDLSPNGGNVGTANGVAANYLSALKYNNVTNAPQNITMDVAPFGTNGCLGDTLTITYAINPETRVSIAEAPIFSIAAGDNVNLNGTIEGGITTGKWAVIAPAGLELEGVFTPNHRISGSPIGAVNFDPSDNQDDAGSVTIVLYSDNPAGPCDVVTDTIFISIGENPIADALNDSTICEPTDMKITLVGHVLGSATSGTWSLPAVPGSSARFEAPVIGLLDDNGTPADDTDDFRTVTQVYNVDPTDLAAPNNSAIITFRLTTNDPDGPIGPVLPTWDERDYTIISRPATSAIGGGGKSSMCLGTMGQYYEVTNVANNTYSWNIPAGVNIANGGTSNWVVLSFPNAGDYTISVTESTPSGCAGDPSTLDIHVYDLPVAYAGADTSICAGEPVILGGNNSFADPSASGGSGTYVYSWNPSFSLDDANIEHPTATPATTITYTLTVTDAASGCAPVTDQMKVTINTINGGSIAGDQTVCALENPGVISSSVNPSGTGVLSYDWAESDNNSDWTLLGENTLTYDPDDRGQTMYYKRIAYSNNLGQICSAESNIVEITWNNAEGGTIGSDVNICSGDDPALLISSDDGTVAGVLAYQWQTSPDGTSYSDIGGANFSTYDPTAQFVTTYYKRKILSTLKGVTCTELSNPVEITVNDVTGGSISGNQTVCNGGDPALISSTDPGTASLGSSSYSWESSIDNFTFNPIPLATDAFYNPPPGLTQTTYYRRVHTSDVAGTLCSAYSNVVTVNINNVSPGSISAGQTLCIGDDVAPFSSVVLGSGTGPITYRWESSLDSTNWSNTGGTAASYNYGTVNDTIWFRRMAISTSVLACEAPSNILKVITNDVDGGTIAGTQTVCEGIDPVVFTSPLEGSGSGSISYQWQSGNDAVSFINIIGATSETYDPPVENQDKYYKRITLSTLDGKVCTAESNILTVFLNDVDPGSISSDQTICNGDDPVIFTSDLAGNGPDVISYRWESRTGANPFAPTGNTTESMNPDPLFVTTDFRRVTISTYQGLDCEANSNVVTINVNDITAGAIGSDQTVCVGETPAGLTEDMPATFSGNISYNWLSSNDSINWSVIPGAALTTYNPGAINLTTWFRRVAVSTLNSQACSDTTAAVKITVNGVNGGAISDNQWICFGGDPDAFISDVDGSFDGNHTYEWQSSTDGINFIAIAGTNALTYDPPSGLTQTTWYRRMISSELNLNTCIDSSNHVIVTINNVDGGEISGDQTICFNDDPSAINSPINGSGSGAISYYWKYSEDGITWNPVGGATQFIYNPGPLTVTTYYQRFTTSTLNSVCIDSSNVVIDTVNIINPGAISDMQTICNGDDPDVLDSDIDAFGSNTPTYQWQSSLDSLTWSNIIGETSSTYNPPVALQTRYYKRLATSTLNGHSCTEQSNAVTVRVNNVDPGSIDGSQTICNGDDPAAFTNTIAGSGSGLITYRWESRTGAIPFAPIGIFTETYNPGVTFLTTDFRRVSISTLAGKDCEGISNVLTVTVNDITAGAIKTDQTICAGETPAGLTEDIPATFSGNISYNWLSSNDSINWSVIPGAALTTYNPGAINLTTWFRRVAVSTLNSQACSDTTAAVKITVNGVNGGTISDNQWICFGGDPDAFISDVDGSFDGNHTYEWQSSTDGINFIAIAGTNALTYDPPSGLTQTTWYRRMISSELNLNTCIDSSNVVIVTINNVDGGKVEADQTICKGDDPIGFNSIVNPSGSGAITYQWESSVDSINFSTISGATNIIYDSPSLMVDTWFRRLATSTLQSNICSALSDTVAVTINNIDPGEIEENQIICNGDDPLEISSKTNATGTGLITYQWQQSNDSINFFNIPSKTDAFYDPPVIYQTSHYRRLATSSLNGKNCSDVSNIITVRVNTVNAGSMGSNQTICYGGDPDAFIVFNAATGTGILSYQWQESNDNSSFADILIDGTNPTYNPGILADTTYFKRIVSSDLDGKVCTAESSVITIIVNPLPTASTSGTDTICEGEFTDLSIALTGRAPWSFTYTDGTNNTTLFSSINPYEFSTSKAGVYEVIAVNDANGCTGVDFGTSATIKVNPLPTADISIIGLDVICEGSTADLQIDLTGTSPWDITYTDGTNNFSVTSASDTYSFSTTVAGVYRVISLTDANSCNGTDLGIPVSLTTQPLPTAIINGTQEICFGNSTNITISVSGSPGPYTIDINNLGTLTNYANMSPVSVKPDVTTSYSVQWIEDANGCRIDAPHANLPATAVVTVNTLPTPDINGGDNDILLCGGESLALNGGANGGSNVFTNHQWTGDIYPLSVYNSENTVFSTKVSETFNLIYTVTDSKSCKGSDTIIITNDRPTASFTSDAVPACGDLNVTFSNNSVGATTFHWNYNDGSAVETTNLLTNNHSFDNFNPSGLVAYFNVKLFAESVNGCLDTTSQIITIYPKVNPRFSIDPIEACQPVVANLVSDPGASSYVWTFGDGFEQSGGYAVFHEFVNTTTSAKTYTVRLTTTSFYNCVADTTAEITVYPLPAPNFSVTPNVQTYPDATVNVISLTSDPDEWTYDYSFGDGTNSSETNPEHTYAESGEYKITQRVSAGSCIDSISQTITIRHIPPVAAFETPVPACTPRQINFVNNSLYGNSYLWEFGDGSTSNKKNPIYTYFEAGTYAVTLTVGGLGGYNSYKTDVTVWPTPDIFFTNAPDSVYVNDKPVKFFNYSSDATNYFWNFGDYDDDTNAESSLNLSTDFEPSHIYEFKGWKDVTLIAKNQYCSDTLVKEQAVWVSPAGNLKFPTVFKPNPNGPTGGFYDPNDPNSKNSTFFPGVLDQVLEYNLYIYNRWGEQIFHSDNVNRGWDGYINDRLAKQGVYIWKVKGKYTNGKNFVEAGDVTLLH
jgi:hypothetical protein